MSQCPGRESETKYIGYVEKKFNVKIHVYPHPEIVNAIMYESYFRHTEVFDPFFEDPEHDKNDFLHVTEFPGNYKDLLGSYFKNSLGKPNLWTAIGIKAGDSVRRQKRLLEVGYADHKKKWLYPIAKYSSNDVYSLLEKIGVKLHEDYLHYGSSFDGISMKYWVRAYKNDPKTWEQIKFWYPMAETMIARDRFRREMMESGS